MAEIANCSRCGKVFAKRIRDICGDCFKKEEKDFDTVYHFLKQRKNREATLQVIVEETGIQEDVIIKFIKNKRLRTTQFPYLAYPCEQCGKDIVTGKYCNDCKSTFLRDLETYQQEEATKSEQKKSNVYYSLDSNKNH